jgi:predicted metal-dependent phosphoesterase TrpH
VNPQINIDLHTHSTHSDGSLTPAELVALAAAAGVQVMALTDHDTITGLEDAQRSTDALGLRLVPGVEISASWRSQAVHVLGLWIDPCSPPLRAMLDSQAERRVLRMRKMCARLSKLGLPGDALLAAVEARPGVPTRAHLAGALLAGGHVASAEGAFRKYLGAGKPAHVSEDWPAVETVVARILGAGGVAALAHPLRYRLSAGARRQLLAGFAAAGGTALEVVTGGNGAHQAESCAQLAVRYGFSGSIGSDFHNPQVSWNPLGRLAKLPDCVVPVWRSHGL